MPGKFETKYRVKLVYIMIENMKKELDIDRDLEYAMSRTAIRSDWFYDELKRWYDAEGDTRNYLFSWLIRYLDVMDDE